MPPMPVDDSAGGWRDTGPLNGYVPIVVALRLIHRPAVIEAAGQMLNHRLGWAFQPGNVLPSHRDGADVRLYGNLLVPVPAAAVAGLAAGTAAGAGPRRGRRE